MFALTSESPTAQALVGTGPMSSDTLLDWIEELKKLLERDVRSRPSVPALMAWLVSQSTTSSS